jgi:hypothetical protein
MINIIKHPLSEAEMLTVLQQCPTTPLLPPIGDPVWMNFAKNAITGPWIESIREQAMNEIDEPMPVLTDELYADFYVTGTRINFEKLYFERRRRMSRAVIAVACDGVNSPLVASAVSKVAEVFNEVSWSLPAHVWNSSDGKDPRTIDLFAAETANMMAQCMEILGPVMPAELMQNIKERLRRDVFENYLENNAKFGWTETTNNWNAVCHQGITGAALATESDLAIVAKMLCEATKHLPACLNSYTADGGCTEGPSYWEYGFGWFIFLNQQLEQRTGGRLSLVEGDEHIKLIAKYGVNVSLSNGYMVNFADAGTRSISGGAELQAYLGKRFGDENCRKMGLLKYQQLAKCGLNFQNLRCDVFYFARLLFNCPQDISETVELSIGDTYLPDLGVMITRGTDKNGILWEFAAKGGNNNEHHNHNDCGNYILNINGKRTVMEIGSPEYNRAFFSDTRYEFLAARTLGHSLPIINGCEQTAGATFIAKIIRNEYSETELCMDIDLTECYKPEADCISFIRNFHLDRINGILHIKDNFLLKEARSLETAIISLVDGSEELAIFSITPDENTFAAPDEIHNYSDHSAKQVAIRRRVMKPRQLATKVSIGYTIIVN